MFRKPVGGPRIVPFGEARRPSDKLANGHPGFRVTTAFGQFDAIFHRPHWATDIANFMCRERVTAMGEGTAIRLQDPNGALGVRVSHPNGYVSEYWHLSKQVAAHGAHVKEGQLIGYHGQTGLDVGGCHLHWVLIDPQGRLVNPMDYIRKPFG